jgi:hypothetical protein
VEGLHSSIVCDTCGMHGMDARQGSSGRGMCCALVASILMHAVHMAEPLHMSDQRLAKHVSLRVAESIADSRGVQR